MILLLLLVCIVLFAGGLVVYQKDTYIAAGICSHKETGNFGFAGMGVSILSGIMAFSLAIVLLGSLFALANTRSYDAEIAVIHEQNTSLEEKISACVVAYLEHEGKTYDSLSPDKAIAYAIALPELSSNVLVQEQICVYKENRDNLQKLLIKKAKVPALRYKVYFGK